MRKIKRVDLRSDKQKYRDSRITKRMIDLVDVERDYEKAVSVFIRRSEKLSDQAYWEMLRALWIACGERENYSTFKALFRANRGDRHYLMTDLDWRLYRSLPDSLVVYRAVHGDSDDGLSWSTSREFVESYAESKGRDVASKRVNKIDIFAYFNSRRENEIILIESLSVSPLDQIAAVLGV